MAQVLVRNLEDEIVEELRRRAKANLLTEIDRIRAACRRGSFNSGPELRNLRDGKAAAHPQEPESPESKGDTLLSSC